MKSIIDDRGQVGIGTLIVFIALVLVAAIAAGVLINTAGFLQTQAEETGQDSTDQVADNINVIGEVGEVAEFGDGALNDDTNEIDNFVREVRLTVQRSPGSNDIDLAGLSIQYVGDNGFAQLIHTTEVSGDLDLAGADTDEVDNEIDGSTDRGDAAYLVEEITAESDGDAVMTDDGDRYEIVIPLATAREESSEVAIIDEEVLDGSLSHVGEPIDDTDAGSETVTDGDLEITDVEETDGDIQFDNLDLGLLEAGDGAELEITTEAGATRNVAISAPDTLIDEEGGTVTL